MPTIFKAWVAYEEHDTATGDIRDLGPDEIMALGHDPVHAAVPLGSRRDLAALIEAANDLDLTLGD